MKVTARFYVAEVNRKAYNPAHAQIVLQPAYADGANKEWSEATPSGRIELQVSNPSAVEWFAERLGTTQNIAVEFSDVVVEG